MKPTIVKQAVHEGKIIKSFSPEIVREVLSQKTVQAMKEILTQAVNYGTGKKASIPGYLVGGKTGTAQKIDPDTKKYSANNYVASFVGFVPVENPKLTILVMIDEPRGIHWGGIVAAPVFREIAKKALRHLNVPSEMNRIYTLPTKSNKSNKSNKGNKSNHSILNAGLMTNFFHDNINLNIRKNVDKFLSRVITGLKNHYWEKDKNA
jgi:membrane peptidoglycan carboxypeptidase